MRNFDRGNQLLATGLAGLAGFVDATGFIATNGFFLSFMSGNSTRLGVGLIERAGHAAQAAGLLGAFVIGVMAGTLTGRAAGRHHRPAVLLFLGSLLAVAAILAYFGRTSEAYLVTAAAMGAENTVFEADGEVRISLTYMTGNLVKIGQRIAGVMLGRGRWEWVPFLALWLAMIGGAVAGAALWPFFGLGGLWVAAAAAVMLALASRLIERRIN
jgi:uncharacterized membrane protein YoaK (UPF0700 family)